MYRVVDIANRLGIKNYLPIKYTIDLGLWTLAAPFAFLLRLGPLHLNYGEENAFYTLSGVFIKAVLIYVWSLHRQSWHSVGVRDLNTLLRAIGAGTVILLALAFVATPIVSIPRSIPLLDGGLALLSMGGLRLLLRAWHEQSLSMGLTQPKRRVLVVGAGEAGIMLVREMLRHPESGLTPIGYLDDEPSKQREHFVGLPVFGAVEALPDVVRKKQVDEVLIAMPSAPGEVVRHVVDLARQAGAEHRIIPGVYDILSGKVSISQIREVDVEDLLRRDPVRLQLEEIARYLEGRIVLVTGAGGSIGSELVRQITRFKVKRLILLDRQENRLYMFSHELRRDHPDLNFETLIADIQRMQKLQFIFETYRPQVVFHTAAHKHVPLMEQSPDEAVLNNIMGTQNLLVAAAQVNVGRFVNISTDKAVRPTSVMGASKRVAEYLVEKASHEAKPGQAYVSVRFGNVLGSEGSVVPLFREQIRRGGPVTVTDPEMTRYFMSIPEATQLVLQAASLGGNGVIYMLNMGRPVRILDLARDLIELSGFEPDIDIPVVFTGIRPGEKLFEELLAAEEGVVGTAHEKILAVRRSDYPEEKLNALLAHLFASAFACDEARIKGLLKELVPTYQPNSRRQVQD
jgi:FlaA1/EpsC-like NDP-sugar epimerase